MPAWFGIVLALLALGFLIFIHELGHFLAARRNGVRVDVFSVGFGPSIFEKKYKGTLYALKLFPLGGFVKLHGEDARDESAAKDKNSFASKTPLQRIEILIAGVVMNFLVAYFVLTVGFAFGWMNPVLSPSNDLESNVASGVVEFKPGAYLKDGSKVIEVNGKTEDFTKDLSEIMISPVKEDTKIVLEDLEGKEQIVELSLGESLDDKDLEFEPLTNYPQLEVVNASTDSGLKEGDLLLKLGNEVLTGDNFSRLLLLGDKDLTIERAGKFEKVKWREGAMGNTVLIADVLPDSLAAKAEIPSGSMVLMLNGQRVADVEEFVDLILSSSEINLELLLPSGEQKIFKIEKNSGDLLGIALQPIWNLGSMSDLQVTETFILGSLFVAPESQISWYQAPFAALKESWHLSKLTVEGFANMLKDLLFKQELSEDVGGIIAVTEITGQLFSYELSSGLIMVALISLSLAAINILPFPALDGGRLLFVFVEVLRGGKKIKPKYETYVHLLGFALLMALILLINFRDIFRLFD